MSRRSLTSEDADLWRYVTRSVTPYRRIASSHPGESIRPPSREHESTSVDTAELSRRSHRPISPPPLAVGELANMDGSTARRFKRGQLPIDARIDLHGLTLVQAHAALGGFIRGAHGRGARCVVVVTGKGSRSGESEGKIRRELPHWLNQPALRSSILAVTEAQMRDGGTGAFYVLLRRRR